MREQLKPWLQETFGPIYEPARDVFWSIFALDQRTNLVWLCAFFLFAFGVYLVAERQGRPGWRGLREYLFPRDVFLHPSAKADYRFFFADKVIFMFAFGWLALSASAVVEGIQAVLGYVPSSAATSAGKSLAVNVGFTLASFVAFDLGYFIAHYLQHRLVVLWEFHKVHHSAEVLTPITNYREHPLDTIVQTFFEALLVGVVTAGFRIAWPAVDLITFLGINAFYLPYFILGNLRHSHVWLSFGWRTSHILSSPAQHQIHHGSAPQHCDVNFGLVLSIWDWLAGTLYVPRTKENVVYGIKGEEQQYPTVWKMYALPFQKAWELIRTGRGLALMPWREGRAPGARLAGSPAIAS